MSDKRDRELVQNAINACFADLKGDPWLARRIINGADDKPAVKKKLSLGFVLAIALAVATMAVAIAAQQLGWVDYFGGRQNVAVPKAAQEAMDATKPISYQVGPMTFTYNQLLTDKRIALSAAAIRLTDGSQALYASDSDVYDPVDMRDDTVLDLYKLSPGTSWLDAAKQLSLPLYGIRALIELDAQYGDGSAMEDAMWNEDGSIVYFNMPMLTPDAVLGELPVTLYMSVTQFDPATGETIERWQTREQAVLPVAPLLAQKTYLPADKAALNGLTLTDVRAERYVTGVYLAASFTTPQGMTADEARDALYGGVRLLDGEGNDLPTGMSLSGGAVTDELPLVTLESMASLEELPDSLLITDGTVEIVVK